MYRKCGLYNYVLSICKMHVHIYCIYCVRFLYVVKCLMKIMYEIHILNTWLYSKWNYWNIKDSPVCSMLLPQAFIPYIYFWHFSRHSSSVSKLLAYTSHPHRWRVDIMVSNGILAHRSQQIKYFTLKTMELLDNTCGICI